MSRNTAPVWEEDELDQGLKTILAIDDEEQLFHIVIETDLSEKAIKKALKKIHNDDLIIEITIQDEELSEELIRYAYSLVQDQKTLMVHVFSLVGEKTLRLREIAAGIITDVSCLRSITKMESNPKIRSICEKKLNNRFTA